MPANCKIVAIVTAEINASRGLNLCLFERVQKSAPMTEAARYPVASSDISWWAAARRWWSEGLESWAVTSVRSRHEASPGGGNEALRGWEVGSTKTGNWARTREADWIIEHRCYWWGRGRELQSDAHSQVRRDRNPPHLFRIEQTTSDFYFCSFFYFKVFIVISPLNTRDFISGRNTAADPQQLCHCEK